MADQRSSSCAHRTCGGFEASWAGLARVFAAARVITSARTAAELGYAEEYAHVVLEDLRKAGYDVDEMYLEIERYMRSIGYRRRRPKK